MKDWAKKAGEEEVREAAVRELTRGWRTDPDTLPFLKDRIRNDEHEYVLWAAVQELAQGLAERPRDPPLPQGPRPQRRA